MKKNWISTICSIFVWGSGQFFICKNRIKGVVLFLAQVLLIGIELSTGYWINYFMGEIQHFSLRLYGGYFTKGIWGLITLGDKAGKNGDHSTLLLINGIIVVLVLAIFIAIYIYNIVDSYRTATFMSEHQNQSNIFNYKQKAMRQMFPYMVIIPILIIMVFIVLMPIIFSVLTAFTNYDKNHLPPAMLVNWVGFKNFEKLFSMPIWSSTFLSVLVWNIIWAIGGTLTSYLLGMFQAILINDKCVKCKAVFRFIYILPWAIPGMISLLVFRNLLNGQFGPINQFLMDMGWITERIPFLTQSTLAKISILGVNLWLCFPVFMLMISGILSNQDKSLEESAQLDGASRFQLFIKIKLPQLLHATAPLIIMNIASNFNAFGSIYFLTEGQPVNPNFQYAGDTDILISWIYKLTLNQQLYGMAAVMNILIFIFVAGVSFWNIKRTSSYKEA